MLATCKTFAPIPIAFALYAGAGFFICVGILKSQNSELGKRKWPFISDAGVTPPQSFIFTLVMSTAAFGLFFVGHTYYCYVKQLLGVAKVNTASWYVIAVASLSMIITGSFQIHKLPVVHFIGAFGVFVFLGVYCVLVTVTSVALKRKKIYPKWIVVLRISIAVIANISQVLWSWLTLLFCLKCDIHTIYNYRRFSQQSYFWDQVIILLIIVMVEKPVAGNILLFASIWEWTFIYLCLIFACTLSYDFAKIVSLKTEVGLVGGSSTPRADAAVRNEAYEETERSDQEQTTT